MRSLQLLFCVAVWLGAVSCSSTTRYSAGSSHGKPRAPYYSGGPTKTVRTTAYSHMEADSLQYGVKNAAGTNLKYGRVRSAAADWSVYPVGTVFRIEGEPYLYEVDDYGSALVGTQTIDLYKPNMTAMRSWGVREVDIEILRWGSYARSLEILEPRKAKAHYVRQMADNIRSNKI